MVDQVGERARYTIDDLRYLMARLRDPDSGCPWDLKQDFASIVHHTLEEAYEVADAIEREHKSDLKDELGDLLFQVIFYARLGEEEGSFDFDAVVHNIVAKLVRRHPHVFPNGDLRAFHPEGTSFSDDQIKQQWEAIKQQERTLKAREESNDSQRQVASVLGDIPNNLPALNRAEKLQRRAALHGFDWPELQPVFDKIEEELGELKHEVAVAQGKLRDPEVHERLVDEMGDLLFCCVNLARFLRVSPDEALRAANQKFVRRFQFIEQALQGQGKSLDDASLETMDALWNEAKSAEKS
ncbi:MAG: nucleoside triphosphate pyrophosphohydrolase [Oleiphilaceae bacterium]|nr:nucleoside triphosphate pyrophosphohydrolase [Oleiphilaceae bacterium]